MLVSIITPTYNSEQFISKTIESVLVQSYTNWELILIDDCSIDDTALIINEFVKKDERIKFIQNSTNSGPAISRNKGIKLAKGKYIAFLDSDDLWMDNKLEKQIDFMSVNKYYFTFSFYSQINEKGVFLKNIDNFPMKVSYKSTLKSNKIGCLTAVYDADFFGKVYMENLAKRQDYTLWLKLLKNNIDAYCCPFVLAKYRVRDNSISSNKIKLLKYHWQIYRRIEKNNFFIASYYIINYVFHKLFINK